MYPTLLKLAGAKLEQPLPLDGMDAWATIAKGEASPHAEILLNTTPWNGAIRMGDWKLVVDGQRTIHDDDPAATRPARQGRRARQGAAGDDATVELFNLAEDVGEKNNLASAQPEKVKELQARYDALAAEAGPFKSRPKPEGFVSPKVWGEAE
jgi:arylsulfatase A-like enzyme